MTVVAGRVPLRQAEPGFSALVVVGEETLRAALAEQLATMGADDIAQTARIAEARATAAGAPPRDLCVIEVAPDDGPGLEFVADLRAAGWRRLLVVSRRNDPHTVRSAFVAGAQGYLLATAEQTDMADGLRRVLDGGIYTDPGAAPALVSTVTVPRSAVTGELSAREVEVLGLVAGGRSNGEIGTDLRLSGLTVKSHLSRIGRKLGTGDRAQMVAVALRAGVID
jgi:DNA-binding NarL/FixJ family response regulator